MGRCFAGGGQIGTEIGAEEVSTEATYKVAVEGTDGVAAAEVGIAASEATTGTSAAVEEGTSTEAGTVKATETGRASALVKGIW